MKWNNLKSGKCPKCEGKLVEVFLKCSGPRILRYREVGHVRLLEVEFQIALFSNLQRRLDGLREVFEEIEHLLGGFEVRLISLISKLGVIRSVRAARVGNQQQDVVSDRVLVFDVVDVICANELQAKVVGKLRCL